MGTKIVNMASDGDAAGEAECWFVRLLEPDCPADDRLAFERWRAASPAHAAAYREVARLWTLGGEAAAGDPAIMAAARRALQPKGAGARVRWLAPVFAAAAMLVLALLVVPQGRDRRVPSPSPGTTYATAIGQQRTVTLQDGSTIMLDTDSAVVVRYGPAVRRIDLLRGRAQFHDVHTARRWPFVVHAQGGTVTALGTEFQVQLDGNEADVTLLEGRLAIATDADGHPRHALLVARQRLEFDCSGAIGPIEPADMMAAKGWTAGKLFVHDWRLPDLLAAMNRYSTTQVSIGDAALRDLRISGVFRAGDQKTLLLVLRQGWSIRARQVSADHIVLSRR